MLLLFIFGGMASGSPVWTPYIDTKKSMRRPAPWTVYVNGASATVDCPRYPNNVDAAGLGYSDVALANDECRDYIAAAAKVTVLTYAFNAFCFMNLFNLINCRKIGADEKNIFERFWHNWVFSGCLFGGFAGHALLVECLPVLLRTSATLTRGEWGGAIAVGATVLAAAYVLKLTPQKWVEMIPIDRFGVDEDAELAEGSMAGRVVGGYRRMTEGEVSLDALRASV